MLRRILLAAIASGLLAGALVTGLQAITTTPLILAAETYENAPDAHHGHAAAHSADAHDHAGPPFEGFERLAYTGASNLITGIGFALLMVAGFALSGRAVDARSGGLWGMAGFATFTLAPGLGLPPELPGMLAADLTDRQTWWVIAAAGTAAALGAFAFDRPPALKAAGILAAVLPHAVGAPEPVTMGGPTPPELAARFTASAIVVSALFWGALGISAGALWHRLAVRD